MKVIFLAYRDWSIKVLSAIKKHPKIEEVCFCKSMQELEALNLSDYKLLITCGWSEELGAKIVSKIEAIGVHCAELDRYSYGSPLQLQIIDGIRMTKHRIFPFKWDEESKRAHTHSREYSHEVDLSLHGNMEDILEQMTVTSKVLFNWFLDDYPNVQWNLWPAEDIIRHKRTPTDSCMSKTELMNMSTEQLYNFFRCLEDPYPNGYIEDEKGKLFICKVNFEAK